MWVSLVAQLVKNQAGNVGGTRDRVGSLGREDPLEEETATHCSILDWKMLWTAEPGRYSPGGCKE